MSKKIDIDKLRKNPINEFTRGHKDCVELKPMNLDIFKQHLSKVHKINLKGLKCEKEAMAHIDGDNWYSWFYHCKLETGLEFSQHTLLAREGKLGG